MLEELTFIKDKDFLYENMPVKIIAGRNCPEIELVGLKIGPFDEGKEYEVRFWIAHELEKAGIARFREEELLNAVKLYKMHWKERIQPVKQISSLPEDFYPRLRRYLADLKREALKKPEEMKEYEKESRLSHDIINSRLKKIVSLASTSIQNQQIMKKLTMEERIIYERLSSIIHDWKSKILKVDDET